MIKLELENQIIIVLLKFYQMLVNFYNYLLNKKKKRKFKEINNQINLIC